MLQTMAADESIEIFCPAKVNLALSVGSPLPNGMHPIASWMVGLNFGDHMTIRRSADGQSHFDISFEPEVNAEVTWPRQQDLSFRAHTLLCRQAGRSLATTITIRKQIPPGAGLGGGSSNAAATLVGLNRLLDLAIGDTELTARSAELGSDVPFFTAALGGQWSAIVSGLGERLEPSPLASVIHLVLVLPPFGCPTGEVYCRFDQLTPTSRTVDLQRVTELSRQPHLTPGDPFNDLTEAAGQAEPHLVRVKSRLQQTLRLPVHVSGSGSALFIVAPSAPAADILARKVVDQSGYRAIAVRTIS